MSTFLFTSESVCEGHPDKMCDQVADAILDECLKYDPNSRVACEVATKTGFLLIFGEIKTAAVIDYQRIVRNVVKKIGYDSSDVGFDYKTCAVHTSIEGQSLEISNAIDHHTDENINGELINGFDDDLGAGDQGIMFGYATDETEELMPLTAVLAHKIVQRLDYCRHEKIIDWLRPDGKSQVTVEYKHVPALKGEGTCIPVRVHTVVVSAQTNDEVDLKTIREVLKKDVILPVIPEKYLDDNTIYHIQPSGKFCVGGPMSDAGMTGRKIIVDTYGGWGAHGGGSFSGKDSTKVDRSAAYAARWVAKSLVSAGLCKRCLVQVSYAIGISHPVSLNINTYGTAQKSDDELIKIIHDNFDLRPTAIIRSLSLRSPVYQNTSVYGHFKIGDFPWENPKKLSF